ncbi:urease accessory protein UreE [Odoribacter sp. Z80]|uniref:urease accessory protein UreE n=1 Tax=Odoribacter sp. Z80 TaxID=2304575 RepID=UPI00137951D6|nr:urease accessory protein UreE [Odoribacter sp. Z80]NCE73086.1 urease accessory protein UreE [Odoribacter sp. Z80]
MKMYTQVLGNMYSDAAWSEKLKNTAIEYLHLDQWTAQKSRFIAQSNTGTEYGIALKRHSQVENGDILEYNAETQHAVVIRIELKPVLIIDLQRMTDKKTEEIIRCCVELGHAIGNQHWPAIVKGTKVYVPLTVDKKVMKSVMDTHHFENITYEFQAGQEIIPFLAPHEIRQLFGGASQELPHIHEPGHNHAHHTPHSGYSHAESVLHTPFHKGKVLSPDEQKVINGNTHQ